MDYETIMSTVSICIPTYNRKVYLRQCLESIRAQTYQDYEIVIVDDGSTDGTEEMIRQLPYIVTYHWQENAGVASASNKLLSLAKSRYIVPIGSDDMLTPGAIERMVEVQQNEPEDVIVYGPGLRMDANGVACAKSKGTLYSGYVTRQLFRRIFVHASGSLFPKSGMQEAGGLDETLSVAEDYDLMLRLSLKYRFVALPEATLKIRQHRAKLSSPSFRNCLIEMKVLERFYFEKGGHKKIPMEAALGKFFKCAYRAFKYAFREGSYKAAGGLLVRSFCLLSRMYFASAIFGDFQGYTRTNGFFQDIL